MRFVAMKASAFVTASFSEIVGMVRPNAKVSDGSQSPVAFDLSLSESAGSRSLHRLVGQFEFDWLPESKASQATSIQPR